MILVILGFGVMGTILLAASHAATPDLSLEAESGNNSSVCDTTDQTASAGQAVVFGASCTPQAVSQIATSLQAVLTSLNSSRPANASIFTWPSTDCPRCSAGIGVAAAALARINNDPTTLAEAEQILDNGVDTELQPGVMRGAPTESGSDIGTMFFADELGPALLMLRPKLSQAQIASWSSSIVRAAQWLVANGNLAYYTNGNITIGNMGVEALAYQMTGNPIFKTYYNQAYDFAVSPDQTRWAGYGFITTKAATKADGSDGMGYFAEAGAGGVGLDIDYVQLQLEQLTRIWLVNHDPQILRLMNMEINTLLAKTNTPTATNAPECTSGQQWLLESGSGSRHTAYPRCISFDDSAYQVLASAGRTDFADSARSQLAVITQEFNGTMQSGDRNYYAVGMIPVSVIINSLGLFWPLPSQPVSTDVLAPSQPQAVTGSINANSLTIHWTASTDNVGVSQYYIRRNGATIATTPASATSFTDTAGVNGTSYGYTVTAGDAAGNVSARSGSTSSMVYP